MKINRFLPLFDNKKQEFNVYKNTLRRLINQAKNIYFSTQFEKNRGDGKKNMANNRQCITQKKSNINT